MNNLESDLRSEIVANCRKMNAIGLNQGTSGNISARLGDRMLISPSSIPYDDMEPSMIASMPIDGDYGSWEGPLRPSSEWRFHLDILRERPEVSATVHAHPPYCTALAIARKPIPAFPFIGAIFCGHSGRRAARLSRSRKSRYRLAITWLRFLAAIRFAAPTMPHLEPRSCRSQF